MTHTLSTAPRHTSCIMRFMERDLRAQNISYMEGVVGGGYYQDKLTAAMNKPMELAAQTSQADIDAALAGLDDEPDMADIIGEFGEGAIS